MNVNRKADVSSTKDVENVDSTANVTKEDANVVSKVNASLKENALKTKEKTADLKVKRISKVHANLTEKTIKNKYTYEKNT